MTQVYAVHVLDSLLDYCQTELFAKYEDAQKAYDDQLNEHHHFIKHVHTKRAGSIYYEGSESNIKILIEKIQIK